MTLLLGPLYHLIDPADRAAALTEAVRVTRPGGLVAAAAISRHAALLELTGLGILGNADLPEIEELLATGRNVDDPQGFTNAHFHRAGELAAELEWAGLDGVVVYGIEGPAAPALDNAADQDAAAVLDSAVRCAHGGRTNERGTGDVHRVMETPLIHHRWGGAPTRPWAACSAGQGVHRQPWSSGRSSRSRAPDAAAGQPATPAGRYARPTHTSRQRADTRAASDVTRGQRGVGPRSDLQADP